MQDIMTVPAEKLLVLEKCLMPSGHTVGCIDDRLFIEMPASGALADLLVKPQEKGPQLLGGSLAPLPALVEAAFLAGKEPNLDELIEIVFSAHKALGMAVTVHMDNHHSAWTPYRIEELVQKVLSRDKYTKISGCGFAGLLASLDNPLGLSEKAAKFFQENTGLVERFVRKGARLIVLKGNHGQVGEVMAVRNNKRKYTLDIIGAHKNKVRAYNHDGWFYEDLIGRCGEVLQGKGEADWTDVLHQNAAKMNDDWLDRTTNILAGMEAVSLQDPTL